MSNPKENVTGFSGRLAELMAKKKMSVRTAAEIAGVPPSSIQAWKTGSLSTEYEGLARLAAKLGVSFEFLLTGANSSRPGPDDIFEATDMLFDGFAKISIQRLIPRSEDE